MERRTAGEQRWRSPRRRRWSGRGRGWWCLASGGWLRPRFLNALSSDRDPRFLSPSPTAARTPADPEGASAFHHPDYFADPRSAGARAAAGAGHDQLRNCTPRSSLLAPSGAPLRAALSRRLSRSTRLRIPHCSHPPSRPFGLRCRAGRSHSVRLRIPHCSHPPSRPFGLRCRAGCLTPFGSAFRIARALRRAPSGCAVAQAVSLRSAPQSALLAPSGAPLRAALRAGGLTPFGSAIRIARALRRAPSGCAVAQAVSLRSAPQSALLAPSGAPLRLRCRAALSLRSAPHSASLAPSARPFGLRCRAGCLTPFGSAFRIPHPAGANGATILQPKPPAHKRQRVLRPPGWPR